MKQVGQIIVGALIVLGALVVIGFVLELWVDNQPIARPTVQTAQVGDVEVEPESAWTNYKQAFYDGCVGERPYNVTEDTMSSYCYCATDYAIDTYGESEVSGWGINGYIPDFVTDDILSRCL